MIGRLRRTTDPVQRRQLRWLAWAAGVIAFTYVMAFAPQAVLGSEEGSRLGGHPRHGRRYDLPADPDHDRHRGPAVPPVRHRLRDPQDRRDRGRRRVHRVRVRRPSSPAWARSSARQRSPLLSALAAAIVALVFQPRAGAGSTIRGPRRLRQARHALRGDDHVRRPAGGDLLLRRRAAAARPGPRRRRRRRASDGLAARRGRPPSGRDVAVRRGPGGGRRLPRRGAPHTARSSVRCRWPCPRTIRSIRTRRSSCATWRRRPGSC